MNATISFIFFILIVVPQGCFGLKCYICSSSQSIYDADCDNGTNAVLIGTCPTNFKACSVKRFIYPDGTTGVLRDCAITVLRDETLLTGQGGLGTTEYRCNYDLCNDYRVESEISTIPSTSLTSLTSLTSSTSSIPSTSTTTTSAASMTSAQLLLLVSIWAFAELLC